MKTKKILSTILATTLLVGSMVGCGTTSSTGSGSATKAESGKTIKVYQLKVEINDQLQALDQEVQLKLKVGRQLKYFN